MINHTLSPNEIRHLENKPCETEQYTRFHIWSISEIMERFSAAQLINAICNLTDLFHKIQNENLDKGIYKNTEVSQYFNNMVADGLKYIRLSTLLSRQIERVSKKLSENECDYIQAMFSLSELKDNIVTELTASRFFQIPENHLSFYEQKTPLFGNNVNDHFLDANRDISAAGRCFALGEWTACVFHLMRVLEIGLRDLAMNIGLSESSVEWGNWKVLIDQIEKQIKILENSSKCPERDKKLQFYSEAASSFRYYKDAWRNYVTHAHKNYSESDAIIIYNNVQAFMQALASHITKSQI